MSCSENLDNVLPDASVWTTQDIGHLKLYRECMRLFCAMEDRSAFKRLYKFDYSIKDH
jgi:hypothetical protein